MCIAIGTRRPQCILIPKRDGGSKPTAGVKAVHYKDQEDTQGLTEGHIKMENGDPHAKGT